MSFSCTYPVLLVEDNPNDLLFMERAILRSGLPFSLHWVADGEQAVSYLQGQDCYSDRNCHPLPTIIISNLKMPRMSGLQLLQWVRQQPQWQDLPVVMLSSSDDPVDLGQAEELGVRFFFVKPTDPNNLVAILQQIVTLLPSR